MIQGWTGKKCPTCKGTGSTNDNEACPVCGGTGDEYGNLDDEGPVKIEEPPE